MKCYERIFSWRSRVGWKEAKLCFALANSLSSWRIAWSRLFLSKSSWVLLLLSFPVTEKFKLFSLPDVVGQNQSRNGSASSFTTCILYEWKTLRVFVTWTCDLNPSYVRHTHQSRKSWMYGVCRIPGVSTSTICNQVVSHVRQFIAKNEASIWERIHVWGHK